MPKIPTSRYYAVLNGRDGPHIYGSPEEYRGATAFYSAASGKSFMTYEEARSWLDSKSKPEATSPKMVNTRYPLFKSRSLCDASTSTTKYADASVQCDESCSPVPKSPELDSASSRSNKRCIPHELPTPPASPLAPPISENHSVALSGEQRRVFDMVKLRKSVFFTGPAGTGKSVLLREIIRHLRSTPGFGSCVAVTAPTGIAGLNIGGSTIYSWGGIGLGKESEEVLAENILASRRLKERWRQTQVLVIDEISMLDGTLFDKLEYIARYVRDSEKPFGGMQLVLCGDFFQLPPVPDKSHNYTMPATFTFDAVSWPRCISQPIFLSQVFRQKDDTFISILSSIRHGELSMEHVQQLERLRRPLHYADGIEPTQLFPLRKEVEACNGSRLNALQGPENVYRSVDSAGWDVYNKPISRESANTLLDRLIAPSSITLKVGAQVMLILNIEQGVLVNGSVGKVTEFLSHHEALKRQIKIAEIPRKSGTMDEKTPPRVKNQEQLREQQLGQLRPINDHCFAGKGQVWPLVQFSNGGELLCSPMAFSVQGFRGNIEAHRMQVPLILAWALSIHKSQGQTLTRVKVDLSRAFEKGQAYVALSRATSMEGLEIVNFQPSKVQAHPRAIQWHLTWTSKDTLADEMDSEEAISRFWAQSGA